LFNSQLDNKNLLYVVFLRYSALRRKLQIGAAHPCFAGLFRLNTDLLEGMTPPTAAAGKSTK
jgi:hypothetical protein